MLCDGAQTKGQFVKKNKRIYLQQKPTLYFDENFPARVIDAAKSRASLKNNFKLLSFADFGNHGKDDDFQLNFCKSKGFVLVSLDRDFLDDRRYPIQRLPGVVIVTVSSNQSASILSALSVFAEFISLFPFPRNFMQDSKFQVNREGCVIRGRDAITREIRTMTVKPGDLVRDVAYHFGFTSSR